MARKTSYGEVPFGDCLTGRHDRCKVTVESMGKTRTCCCDCENHGVNYEPSPPPRPFVLEMLNKWYPNGKKVKFTPEP